MSESSETPKPSEGERPLTAEYANRLFIDAFRFSQGEEALHDVIVLYAHLKHPEWKIDDDLKEKVKILARKDVEERLGPSVFENVMKAREQGRSVTHGVFTTGGALIDKGVLDSYVPEKVDKMAETFNSEETEDLNEVIPLIAASIIRMDHIYLTRPEGRFRINIEESGSVSPESDPWLSHICYFGFEGYDEDGERNRRVRLPEYDEMFDEIVKFVRETPSKLDERTQRELAEVEKIYAEKHPKKRGRQ